MAVIDIYNEKQLREMLDKVGRRVIWMVEQSVKQHLVEETKNTVYAEKPSVYQRTYGFLNSISSETVSIDNRYLAQIYFDEKKMSVSQGIFAKNVKGRMVNVTYGKHADNKGRDVRNKMVMYLEEGFPEYHPVAYTPEGKRAGLHMYKARPGNHMIKNTRRWVFESMVPIVLGAASGVIDNKINVFS